MTSEEIKKILELHKKWLNGEEGGVCADLIGTDLRGTDLRGTILTDANLSGAILTDADLIGTDLRGTDLRGTDLRRADLSVADLSGANLSVANLRYANLSCADLSRANLSCANLRYAILRYANLSCADLSGADLSGADLSGAGLRGVDLSDSEKHRLGVILEKARIGYKKLDNGIICKLSIPKGAIVFCINGSKCRTNKCKVLEGEGVSGYDKKTKYKVGKKLEIKDFNLMYNVECSTGIHFFWSREEAEHY